MKYVYSAYVAQCEVSHSYNKGVPKNITQRKHSYQHKNQQELESLKLGWACSDFFQIRLLMSLKLCYKTWKKFSKGTDGFVQPAETLERCLLILGVGKNGIRNRISSSCTIQFSKLPSSHYFEISVQLKYLKPDDTVCQSLKLSTAFFVCKCSLFTTLPQIQQRVNYFKVFTLL